jgi:hypothetical protein
MNHQPAYDTDSERAAIRELILSLYRAISGPAGVPRDWDAFRAVFVPDARIAPFHIEEGGEAVFTVLTPEDYVTTRTPIFAANAFFEDETTHDVTISGRIAHVFSGYEARRAPEDEPFTWGVNSIQLVRGADRWRVTSMTWEFTGLLPKSD